jgi:hypothetical protein
MNRATPIAPKASPQTLRTKRALELRGTSAVAMMAAAVTRMSSTRDSTTRKISKRRSSRRRSDFLERRPWRGRTSLTTQAVRPAASSSFPHASRLDPPWSPAAWHAGEPADRPGSGHARFLLRLRLSCPVGVGTHSLRLCQLAFCERLKLRQPDWCHLGRFPVNSPALGDPPAFCEDGRLLPQHP